MVRADWASITPTLSVALTPTPTLTLTLTLGEYLFAPYSVFTLKKVKWSPQLKVIVNARVRVGVRVRLRVGSYTGTNDYPILP